MGDPVAASRRKHRLPNGGSESSDLHAAARNGDVTSVESICNANPLAVNSRDRHSRTPSTDLESKPEGREARKQRRKEGIRARLIIPLPPAATSLVGEMPLGEGLRYQIEVQRKLQEQLEV
ncbi:hypothetical protein OPV22_000249 [Ensete ventricosum]|uniref:MYB-CC type transcription factor LHEQLE-containing domain-containing protein n=1 Tax=Ensete ventricosum TaxID=4639 RepID=A0AAV8RUD6_ENSVE|nr:hypothetical protein OPV22_000249 [Ensete ventricosum]